MSDFVSRLHPGCTSHRKLYSVLKKSLLATSDKLETSHFLQFMKKCNNRANTTTDTEV